MFIFRNQLLLPWFKGGSLRHKIYCNDSLQDQKWGKAIYSFCLQLNHYGINNFLFIVCVALRNSNPRFVWLFVPDTQTLTPSFNTRCFLLVLELFQSKKMKIFFYSFSQAARFTVSFFLIITVVSSPCIIGKFVVVRECSRVVFSNCCWQFA